MGKRTSWRLLVAVRRDEIDLPSTESLRLSKFTLSIGSIRYPVWIGHSEIIHGHGGNTGHTLTFSCAGCHYRINHPRADELKKRCYFKIPR